MNDFAKFIQENLLLVILVGIIILLLIIGFVATAIHKHHIKVKRQTEHVNPTKVSSATINPTAVCTPEQTEEEEATYEEITPIGEPMETQAETLAAADQDIAEPLPAADVEPTTKKQTSAATPKKKSSTKQKRTPEGKWIIYHIRDGEFCANLFASNGELMLSSEIYATAESAKSAVATISRSIKSDLFSVHCDKNDNYFFKLKTASNRLLCIGETYPTKAACEKSIDSVKKFAENSTIIEGTQEPENIVQYEPKPLIVASGKSGKWIIREAKGQFTAFLYANNGELLLSSEEYMTAEGAKSGMATIKKNALANHFVIDVTKGNKFCFKLRNANRTTLCVGTAYDTQTQCEQSIESVKRFCQTAVLEATKRETAPKTVRKTPPKTTTKKS